MYLELEEDEADFDEYAWPIYGIEAWKNSPFGALPRGALAAGCSGGAGRVGPRSGMGASAASFSCVGHLAPAWPCPCSADYKDAGEARIGDLASRSSSEEEEGSGAAEEGAGGGADSGGAMAAHAQQVQVGEPALAALLSKHKPTGRPLLCKRKSTGQPLLCAVG